MDITTKMHNASNKKTVNLFILTFVLSTSSYTGFECLPSF